MPPKLKLSRFVVVNFILLEIVIIGAGSTMAFHLGRNHLIGVAEQNSVAVANHMARVLDEFYLQSWDLTFETFPYDNPLAHEELRGIIVNFLQGFKVQRVNVYNMERRIIFSTDSALIGTTHTGDPELESALAGRPASSLEHETGAEGTTAASRPGEFLCTYVPVMVRGADGSHLRMAFEVYLDVSDTYSKVRALRNVIMATSLFTGLALLIVVLLISRRAERMVAAENHERLLLAEQIQRQNEHLEDMVDQRTRQLKDAQAELVQMEKMAATGQLAAGVAHEINNPVSIIQNRLELLLEDVRNRRDVPDLDAHLSMMHKHTQRISQIVSRLLSFARKSTTGKSSIELDTVLSGVLTLVRKEVEKRGVEFVAEFPEHLGPVKGNATELEQVFVNLIVNAMDATPPGGRISLGARQVDGHVAVAVRDTGHGIAPEDLRRIFDPFFTTKAAGTGTGLGLAVTYRLVEDHGGRIEVASSPGHGTAFTITFPVIEKAKSA